VALTTLSQFVDGQLVLSNDLNSDNDATRNLVAEALVSILGAVNAMPQPGAGFTPLTVALSASALSFTIGGPGQNLYVQQRVVDYCPTQILTIPTNSSGVTRNDLISVQYAQLTTNPISREIEASNGTVSTGTVYQLNEGLNYSYLTGTASPPAGYVAFATLAVPNGATTASACTLTYLFPTMQSLIVAVVGTVVQSLNGATGVVTMVPGTGITISAPVAGSLTIANSGVTTLGNAAAGSLAGAVTITAGTAIGISGPSQGRTDLKIDNTGVTSIAGQKGDVVLLAGAGIGLSQPSPTQTTVTNTGVTTINTAAGAINLAAGLNVTITQVGSTITIASAGAAGAAGATGATGAAGPQGIAGAVGPAGPNGGIGSTAMARTRILDVVSTVTVTLPYALQSGNWLLYAEAQAEFNGGSMTLTGAGASLWEGASTCPDLPGGEFVSLNGQAVGGQTPSVSLTFSGASAITPHYYGQLILWAVRTS